MGKSTEEKLFHYIKVGKLHRVRSLLKKHKPSHLTAIVDRNGRTPLHVCCLLGNDAMMRLLLKNGAKVEVTDSDGNTPIHFALKYAVETTRFSAYNDLVLPLLNVCSRYVLNMENSDGKTARECLSQLKRAYAQRRREAEAQRKQQRRMEDEEMTKNEEELEWERKLRFEAGQEDFSKYRQGDYQESAHETYDEWVERIMHERWKKNASSKQQQQKKEAERKRQQQQEESRNRTKELEKEHEAYITRVSIERQKLKLVATLTEYEKQCQVIFDSNLKTNLKFIDIPWPGKGDTKEMINIIVKWSEMKTETEEERRKFLKEQQVRWHPDKFLQKCGIRLGIDDREKIIEQVKELSQEINSLLD